MKYEFKKLFSSKLMLIILALTLAYMIYLPVREVWGGIEENRKTYRSYENIIAKAQADNKTYGELYEEINDIFANGEAKPIYSDNAINDVGGIMFAADKLQYVTTGFESDRKELVKGMIYQNVTEQQKESPDKYLIRANKKAISQYNRRIALKFENTGINSSGYYSSFNYSMWEFVMISLCVMMTVRLFTLEYTTSAYRLVNTSRRTVQSLFFKKYLAVLSIAALVLLVQAVFEIGFGMYAYGAKNFSLPLQQIAEFEYCPYTVSIAGFYVIKYFVRLICYTAVISAAALIAVLIKRSLIVNIISIIISAGGLAANMALFVTIDKSEKSKSALIPIYDKLRIFLPQSLLNIREYLKGFDCFSLFGFPCSRIAFCIALAVIISLACAALGYIQSGKIRRAA